MFLLFHNMCYVHKYILDKLDVNKLTTEFFCSFVISEKLYLYILLVKHCASHRSLLFLTLIFLVFQLITGRFLPFHL